MAVFVGTTASVILASSLAMAAPDGWSKLSPSTPPEARYDAVAIYDPLQNRVVLFGGLGQPAPGQPSYQDVWQFTQPDHWVKLAATGAPPPAANDLGFYDPVRHRMLVTHGHALWGLSLSDPMTWTPIPTAGDYSLIDACGVYDSMRDRILEFGSDGSQAEVLELPLSSPTPTWSTVVAAGGPSNRWNSCAVYDPVRDRMVIFGGGNNSSNVPFHELWSLEFASGPTWTLLTPPEGSPQGRLSAAAVYDAPRDRMVIFGGHSFEGDPHGYTLDDTWAFTFAGGTHAQDLTSQVGTPQSEDLGALALDSQQDAWVMFGGNHNFQFPTTTDDTYQLQFGAIGSSVDGRFGFALGIDAARWHRDGRGGEVSLTLPRRGSAALELFDLSGRRWLRQAVGEFGPGHHDLTVRTSARLPSGVFFLRLTQGTAAACRTLVVQR